MSLLAARVGVTRALELLAKRPCLVVLNYHRIGPEDAGGYDPGPVSATAEQFDQQMAALKRSYHVVGLAEAEEMVTDPARIRHSHVLVTFDDGYRDNHAVALPILKAHGLSAAFFLATSFVGTRRVPWWDQIAFLIRNTRAAVLRLRYPRPVALDLRVVPVAEAIREVLELYKHRDTKDSERFLSGVEAACDVPREREVAEGAPPLFMSWAEARELVDAGMGIGSHTHNHELLAKQTREAQLGELRQSREVIRAELGVEVRALAFPDGSRASFSAITEDCLRAADYRTAFSYYGGVNVPPSIRPLDVRRLRVGRMTLEHYRLRTSLAALSASLA